MKLVIQRVSEARVSIAHNIVSQIGYGLLILVGITHTDTSETVQWLTQKVSKLRIFTDDYDKLNLSILDIKGEILVVSQFTLYADAIKGNRPSFIDAALPAHAKLLYELFIDQLRAKGINTATGTFAADMQVHLINDGPVTIVLEK